MLFGTKQPSSSSMVLNSHIKFLFHFPFAMKITFSWSDMPLMGSLDAGVYWAFRVGGLVALAAYYAICLAVVWFKKYKKYKKYKNIKNIKI
jgi:hypothetical protein